MTEWGRCLQRSWSDRPGKLVRYPLVRAVERVESAGKNNAVWANATISAGVAEPIAAFVCSVVGADWDQVSGVQ